MFSVLKLMFLKKLYMERKGGGNARVFRIKKKERQLVVKERKRQVKPRCLH